MARRQAVFTLSARSSADLARVAHAQAFVCDEDGKASAGGPCVSVTNHGGVQLTFWFHEGEQKQEKSHAVAPSQRLIVGIPASQRRSVADGVLVEVEYYEQELPEHDELDSVPLSTDTPSAPLTREHSAASLPPHDADLEDDADCCLGLCDRPGWYLEQWLPESASKRLSVQRPRRRSSFRTSTITAEPTSLQASSSQAPSQDTERADRDDFDPETHTNTNTHKNAHTTTTRTRVEEENELAQHEDSGSDHEPLVSTPRASLKHS